MGLTGIRKLVAVVYAGLALITVGCVSADRPSKSIVTREPARTVCEYISIEKPINGIGTVVDSKPGRTIARLTSPQGLAESLEYKPKPTPEPTYEQIKGH